MQLDVVVMFFLLGVFARAVGARLEFPQPLYESILLFLLLAIGLKGGIALHEHASLGLIPSALAVLLMGLVMPIIAYPLLSRVGGLSRENAASVAAHYGSVSIGTYAVAVSLLETRQIFFEPWFALYVALLEVPAIAVGIWLARPRGESVDIRGITREVLLNQGVLLLVGGLTIGWWAGSRAASIIPVFGGLFHGVLALFLLKMGMVAASRITLLRQYGSFITSFGVMMPLLGAIIGALAGHLTGMSEGGMILLATLGASASYIAVPAAMAVAVPRADQALPITASLAVTFPFNVLVGIPLYIAVIHKLVQ